MTMGNSPSTVMRGHGTHEYWNIHLIQIFIVFAGIRAEFDFAWLFAAEIAFLEKARRHRERVARIA